jgi:hypothetical protein
LWKTQYAILSKRLSPAFAGSRAYFMAYLGLAPQKL